MGTLLDDVKRRLVQDCLTVPDPKIARLMALTTPANTGSALGIMIRSSIPAGAQKSIAPPPVRLTKAQAYCKDVLAQVEDFRLRLPADHSFLALLILADGSRLELRGVQPLNDETIVYTGETPDGFRVEAVASVGAATLKLVAVPPFEESEEVAQELVGFRAPRRQAMAA